jgi:hypothetical protein
VYNHGDGEKPGEEGIGRETGGVSVYGAFYWTQVANIFTTLGDWDTWRSSAHFEWSGKKLGYCMKNEVELMSRIVVW